METQLKLVRLLSLKDLALRRVVILLWSGSDILKDLHFERTYAFYFFDLIEEEATKFFEPKVSGKISKLELPESLQIQVTDLVRPVGLQISRWGESQTVLFSAVNKDSRKFCWTAAGTINYLKTAELFYNENRFKMCEQCNHINMCLSTWDNSLENYIAPEFQILRKIWENRRAFNASMFSNVAKFVYSLEKGNRTAAEYLFQKLSLEEREVVLSNIVYDDAMPLSGDSPVLKKGTSEVLSYLLSLLTPEQQMEIVQSRPIDVFLCFFHWPWPDLMLLNAGLVWIFVPPSSYDYLFSVMIRYFGKAAHYFPESFQEFFVQSPPDFKKYFLESEVETSLSEVGTPASRLLHVFFENEDSECVRVIFRNVDAASRVKLVFHPHVLHLFHSGISKKRWPLVEACLQEAALGREDSKKLQSDFKCFLSGKKPRIRWWKGKWKPFFDFLDKASTRDKKKYKRRKCRNLKIINSLL